MMLMSFECGIMRVDRLLLTLPLSLGTLLGFANKGIGQSVIVPDETLGPEERSLVIPDFLGFPVEAIDGGAQRGQNLFHSFREFNVDNGRGAYFAIPNLDIRNVLTRVTGSNRSEVLGTIGTFLPTTGAVSVPNVNFFLINPNGILFGENASLDVGGSFFATTASGVQLGDGVFSATQPERPADVLTVDPSAFLFGSNTPGRIDVRSEAAQTVLGNRTFGLRVPNGETLLLLGGDIVLDGGLLTAFGGRIEIGAISGNGQVGLTKNGRLQVPGELQRADVSLLNEAGIRVALEQDGDIGITARNIVFSNRSSVSAGIASGLGAESNQAGDIRLNATGEVWLGQESRILNIVDFDSIGNSGNLIIEAKSLFVTNGSQLSTSIFGQGNGGNIQIMARDRVLFQGTSVDGQSSSAVFSNVGQGGLGNGGNIDILAPVLEVSDGAVLSSSTFGIGDAGNLQITASDLILFQNGVAFNNVGESGVGKGGNIVIAASVLEVRDGSQLITSTRGKGDGGNLLILSRDRVQFQNSIALSSIESRAAGDGGNLSIISSVLEVLDGSEIGASNAGQGQGGNIQVLAAQTVLAGDKESSVIFSRVLPTGQGGGGVIDVDTNRLSILDGSQILATSEGAGIIGNIAVQAENIELIGFNKQLGQASGLSTPRQFTAAEVNSIKFSIPNRDNTSTDNRDDTSTDNRDDTSTDILLEISNPSVTNSVGGNILVRTKNLLLSSGAAIDARTTGQANAGNIVIEAQNISLTNGGRIISTTENQDGASGRAGDIRINASREVSISGSDREFSLAFPQLRIQPSSGIFVQSDSFGAAGTLSLTTPSLTLDQQGRIDAQSATVNGGNINLTVPGLLLLRNNSQISATAGTANSQASGNGGNIDINARFIIGIPQENSDITANAAKDRGGNLKIRTQGLFGLKVQPQTTSSSDITASSEGGPTGNITLTTPDNSAIQNNLSQLSTDNINPEQLIAKTCIVRQNDVQGRFAITGNTNLPNSPGTIAPSTYATATIQTTKTMAKSDRPWKLGDPIIEPTGFYRLADDRLVLGRECAASPTP
jgi:filamentous hemagglutinin family protein